jgi:hypothetical protein
VAQDKIAPEKPAKPAKLMVTKTTRISTISGVLVFKQGKTFTDPSHVGLIRKHKIPHMRIPDALPDNAVPTSGAPDTHD